MSARGTMEIPLSRGLVALIDSSDAETVTVGGKWHAVEVRRGVFYARRSVRLDDGRRGKIGLHTFLTGWALVDHINGDGLDNRRSNLRAATNAENVLNKRRYQNNTSGFKGVSFSKAHGRWTARVQVNGQRIFLGLFDGPALAAHAYDDAAREHHGQFARLNFPDEVL